MKSKTNVSAKEFAKRMVKEGKTHKDIAVALNEAGYTNGGKPYTQMSIWRLFKTRTYNKGKGAVKPGIDNTTSTTQSTAIEAGIPQRPAFLVSDVVRTMDFCRKWTPDAKRAFAAFLLADA